MTSNFVFKQEPQHGQLGLSLWCGWVICWLFLWGPCLGSREPLWHISFGTTPHLPYVSEVVCGCQESSGQWLKWLFGIQWTSSHFIREDRFQHFTCSFWIFILRSARFLSPVAEQEEQNRIASPIPVAGHVSHSPASLNLTALRLLHWKIKVEDRK